jgi:peptide chain release factor 1
VIFDEKLDRLVARRDELSQLMSSAEGIEADEFVRLSKEYAEITPVVACIEELRAAQNEIADLGGLVADQENDAEMRALAEEEMRVARERLPEIERQVQLMLLPKDSADEKNAILEIRAGTGGDEAALFAADLFRMYQRYAALHGWRFEPMQVTDTGIGGFKEAVVNITGKNVFARLKYESGVHRVQRVPETESGGRIHTSAATVAVLPEAEEIDVQVEEKDLRILPTGIVVSQQDEKSQHKNRAKGMKVLRARIYEAQRHAADAERAESRKSQVGSGDRSERIRTYNFPQGRVTDHRISLTLHKLYRVLEGEALDEIVDALTSEDQASRLAELA